MRRIGAFAALIVVALAAGCAPQEPREAESGPEPVLLERGALANTRQRIDFLAAMNPDCSPNPPGVFKLLAQPEHGTVQFGQGRGFAEFPRNNPRARCSDRQVPGTLVYFIPQNGYVGPDEFLLEWITPNGYIYRREYEITVR